MRRSFALGVATLAFVATVAVGVAPTVAAEHQVRVEDNVFVPKLLQIQPGDTVVWTAMRSQHSVTADDGRFNFPDDRPGLDAGERVSWTFGVEEEFRYYCRIHGQPGGGGMSGVIRVGDPPSASVPDVPTLVVPDDSPTIRDAAAGARSGTQVLVRPGVYREAVVVTVPGLEIRGLGARPDEVVVDGENRRDIGITVAAPGVRIVNLAITGNRRAGIVVVEDVAGTVISDAHLKANGLYGIEALAPAGINVRGGHIDGHGVAAIGIRGCEACGALIDAVSLERNAAGIVVVDAAGLVVRDSHINNNAVGIVLRNVSGARVTHNVLTANAATELWVAGAVDGAEPPGGAGVWIRGGRGIVVASNTVTGHTYNVAVAGVEPVLEHRISNNVVGGATFADLALDALGARVCFSGNKVAPGGEPSSHPPALQTTADCASPATVAVPHPLVTANLLSHARGAGYPT